MLILIISGLCLFLTLGLGSIFLVALLPVLFFKFPSVIMTTMELLISLAHFYGEIMIFLLGFCADIGEALIHVFVNSLPIVTHFGTLFCHSVSEWWHSFQQYGLPQIRDFVQRQTDLFIIFWGVLVTTFCAFLNSLRIPDAENANNENENDHNENHQHNWGNDGQNNDNADDVIGRENGRRTGQNNGRHRNQHRLYPDLHEFYGDGFPANRPDDFQDRNCVVCFEQDRSAAMFPCGHTQTCLSCTRNIMARSRRCPICQQRIEEFRQVYV